MTSVLDRSNDVACLGCGTYIFSYYPNQKEPKDKDCYCPKCKSDIKKGVKNGRMADYEWYGKSEKKLNRLFPDSKLERFVIGSFNWTQFQSPEKLPRLKQYNGKIKEMTEEEWKKVSLEKLGDYKKYCNKKELKMLEDFIYK